MFFLQPPTAARIESIVNSQRDSVPKYNLTGATRDYHAVQLGSGEGVFQAARRALRNWEMMDLGWLRVVVREPEVGIVIHHYGFWSINVSRVMRVEDAATSYTMVYGTLPEHAESGEERFTVRVRSNGAVWYEIEAFSRPRHPLARLGYPLTRRLQKRFARDSMRRMQSAVNG